MHYIMYTHTASEESPMTDTCTKVTPIALHASKA